MLKKVFYCEQNTIKKKVFQYFFEIVFKTVGELSEKHYLCMQKTYTMSEELFQVDEIFTDESELLWIVAEVPSRDYSLDNKRATQK